MSDASGNFAGSIPELYDRFLGPVLFEPYAQDLSRRLADQSNGTAVLETACGTGILTRRLRAHLPPEVRLVATDLNQSMIDHARGSLGDAAGIEWRQADCTALPFQSASFGVVACQFGMMFPPDKRAAVRDARRVLADGGVLAFNVWDSLEQNPYARVMQEALASFFPDDPPRFFDVPYGFHDVGFWTDLLRSHGFADLEHEAVTLEARSPTAEQLAYGQVCGGPLSHEIRQRGGSFDRIVEAITAALAGLGGVAPFSSPMQAIVIRARAR